MDQVRTWTAATAVTVVLIAVAGWFLAISPSRSDAAALREQTAEAERSARDLRTQLAVLQAQERELPAKRRRLDELAARLPADVELPALTRDLEAAGQRAGVTVERIAPGAPTPVAVPGGEPLSSVRVELKVAGGFYQVAQFLHELEELPRALLVTGFDAQPASGAGVTRSRPPLTVTVDGQVFTRPAAAGAPGSPVAAGGTATVGSSAGPETLPPAVQEGTR